VYGSLSDARRHFGACRRLSVAGHGARTGSGDAVSAGLAAYVRRGPFFDQKDVESGLGEPPGGEGARDAGADHGAVGAFRDDVRHSPKAYQVHGAGSKERAGAWQGAAMASSSRADVVAHRLAGSAQSSVCMRLSTLSARSGEALEIGHVLCYYHTLSRIGEPAAPPTGTGTFSVATAPEGVDPLFRLTRAPACLTAFAAGLIILLASFGAHARPDGPVPLEKELELSAIRRAIDDAGAHWIAEHNSISLLPREEFRRMLGGGWPQEVRAIFDTLKPRQDDLQRTYPDYWDWREMGGVTGVRNQGSCGSCWDFAAVGATEGNLRINEGIALDLSEQQALDCNEGGSSCSGGWQGDAYNVFTDPGAVSEECMPYLATEGTCRQRLCEKVAIIDGFQYIAGNVNSYKAALMEGPISTCYTVYEDFDEYSSGCYEHTWGSVVDGHCITIVGWDDSMCGGEGAWICKNSWGTGWGVAGYFYIKYGECGIGYGAERPLNAHVPRERFVPDEFATIQEAIDNSNRGDVIRVAGGTYPENVTLEDYRILYGGYDPSFSVRDPEAYPTVIDAGGAGHGFLLSGCENVVIDGFEVTNASEPGDYGIYISASEVQVRNCDVHDCWRGVRVGGYASGDVSIERTTVRENQDIGVYLYDADNPTVRLLLTAIYDNGAEGLYSHTSPVDVINCTIAVNGSTGGISLVSSSGNEIENSIIASNTGYGISCQGATPVLSHNDVWGNSLGDYSGCSAGTGSISVDPIFCDAEAGDVAVHATSPTLGAGEGGEDLGALGVGCPTGPTNLRVSQNGASLVLTWSPPDWARASVNHYVVYRDTSLFPTTAVATVAASETVFVDVTVAPCLMHNYWVSAVDDEGLEGALSNRTYAELCYPGPSGLVVAFGEGGNEMSWSAGGGPIDHYVIMRSTEASAPDSVGWTSAGDTSYIDTSTAACPRDNYAYEIVPVYDTGWRGQATEAVAVDPAPSPPTGLTAEWSGADIVLTWNRSCESDARNYWVYRDTMPLSPPPRFEFLIGQTGDTVFVDEGPPPGPVYFYRIVVSDGSSQKSGYSQMAYVGQGQRRTVPGEYATIQAAIDAACALDTVLVSPGAYQEMITLKDGVFLMSTDGREATTITSPSGPIVTATGLCDLSLIRGFTIDGQGSATRGMDSWGSYVRVEDCAFTECGTGARFHYGGSPSLARNLFSGNDTGIAVADSANPFLSCNTFDGNSFCAIQSSGDPGPEIGGSLADANDFVNVGVFQVLNTSEIEIEAELNWWDAPCPDAAWFYGAVDYVPWTDEAHAEAYTECTGVPDGGTGYSAYASRSFPNPFNPTTTIRYVVPEPGATVRLDVYDLAGRHVRTLASGATAPGEHVAVWDGRDDAGRVVGSGVYFCRIEIGKYRVERKMVMLK